MYCPKCGHSHTAMETFCTNCGASLTPDTDSQDTGSQGNSYQSNSYQSNSYQSPGSQGNGYQSNSYQNNSYQSPGSQGNSYQNNSYQSPGPQGNSYQNNSYQSTGYQNPYQPSGYQPGGNYTGAAGSDRSRVIAAAKSELGSPLVLATAIAYTLYIFLSLPSMFNFPYYLYDALPYELYNVLYNSIGGIYIFANILLMIPAILFAVGLWMTYFSASQRNSLGVKTSGLTIMKSSIIAEIVEWCLAFVLIFFAVIVALSSLRTSRALAYIDPGVTNTIVQLIGLVLVIPAIVLIVLFIVNSIKTLNTIKTTAETGMLSANVSVYVAVMLFIMAGAGLLTNLASLGNGFTTQMLSAVSYNAARIMLGILILSYRSKMRSLMYAPPIM